MQKLLLYSDAGVAQLVEQLIRNEKVGSSSLFSGTITKQPEFHSGFFVSTEYRSGVYGDRSARLKVPDNGIRDFFI